MFFRTTYPFPVFGFPLGGGPSPTHDDIEEGSDIQFGHLLASNEELAPHQERFFDVERWKPKD